MVPRDLSRPLVLGPEEAAGWIPESGQEKTRLGGDPQTLMGLREKDVLFSVTGH